MEMLSIYGIQISQYVFTRRLSASQHGTRGLKSFYFQGQRPFYQKGSAGAFASATASPGEMQLKADWKYTAKYAPA